MKATNGTNGVANKSVPTEDHVYPNLFKVVHKDLFNVSSAINIENNISWKENGEKNWEFFLNFKFSKMEVSDEAFSTFTKGEKGSSEK